MKYLMCRACGELVLAFPRDDDAPVPRRDSCPDCDGKAFKDIQSGQTLQTD